MGVWSLSDGIHTGAESCQENCKLVISLTDRAGDETETAARAAGPHVQRSGHAVPCRADTQLEANDD